MNHAQALFLIGAGVAGVVDGLWLHRGEKRHTYWRTTRRHANEGMAVRTRLRRAKARYSRIETAVGAVAVGYGMVLLIQT